MSPNPLELQYVKQFWAAAWDEKSLQVRAGPLQSQGIFRADDGAEDTKVGRGFHTPSFAVDASCSANRKVGMQATSDEKAEVLANPSKTNS